VEIQIYFAGVAYPYVDGQKAIQALNQTLDPYGTLCKKIYNLPVRVNATVGPRSSVYFDGMVDNLFYFFS
jgi:hypothetical protein